MIRPLHMFFAAPRASRLTILAPIGMVVSMCVALLVAWPAAADQVAVELTNVGGEYRKNIEAFLSIYRERESPDLLESRVHRLHEKAPEEIRRALAPFGLYRVQVEADLEQIEPGSWRARYAVESGPAIPIGRVDVQIMGEGADAPDRPAIELKPGAPFTHEGYEQAKSRLRRFAQDRGYLEAAFERSEVVVDLDAYRADIYLHLDTGRRFYFGEVEFLQERFDPEFLHRYVTFEPGTPYSFTDLMRFQGALLNTNYFGQVEVGPRMDAVEDQRIPIEVLLVPNKPNRYRAGVGYATDVGPRVSFDWTRRYIGSRGHNALAAVSISQDIQTVRGSYRIPVRNPTEEYVSFQTGFENYDTASREGYVASLRGDYNKISGALQRIVALEFELESPEPPSDTFFYTLIPSVNWVWKKRDDLLYATRGYQFELSLAAANEALLSSTSFLQGRIRSKGIYSPIDTLRLIGRAEIGATLADGIGRVPPSWRFYAGGDNSVRGYAFEELAPVDASGERVGGAYIVTASLELERRLTESWSVAAFYDTGNAFNDFADLELARGVGIGVRWLSPVGPVRVDLARGLNLSGDPFRIHLVIGPDI